MIGGRLRSAVNDVAETLRRVFRDPPSREVALGLMPPAAGEVPALGAQAVAPAFRPEAAVEGVDLLIPDEPLRETFVWEASVRAEEAWARWVAGVEVCTLPLFRAESTGRLEVPPLPPRAATRNEPLEGFRTRSWCGLEAMPTPRGLQATATLAPPRTRRALDLALALPVAFPSEDIPRIPKNLWMRYTLRLIKETGENIRNLEVLGLYQIPVRGTRQVDHEAATGRLRVTLGPEAAGAEKAPFILARKKDDGSIVCCFVEDV